MESRGQVRNQGAKVAFKMSYQIISSYKKTKKKKCGCPFQNVVVSSLCFVVCNLLFITFEQLAF